MVIRLRLHIRLGSEPVNNKHAIASSLIYCGEVLKFLLKNPNVWLAFVTTVDKCLSPALYDDSKVCIYIYISCMHAWLTIGKDVLCNVKGKGVSCN